MSTRISFSFSFTFFRMLSSPMATDRTLVQLDFVCTKMLMKIVGSMA